MVGWVIEQLDRFVNLVTPLYHPMEKPCAHATAFRTVIHLDLEQTRCSLLVLIQGLPRGFECIDNKVTGFVRATKRHVQLPHIFIHNATRNILLLASQVMITGLVIASREAATRHIADVYRGFTIDTQAFDGAR